MALTLYAAKGQSNTTSELYSVDPVTLALTDIGPIGFAVTGLAMDPSSGMLYGLTSDNSTSHPHSLITIDTTTGAGTFVANIRPIANDNTNASVSDICFDASAQMYGVSSSRGGLVQINKATGSSTRLTTELFDQGGGLDFDSDGTLWWIGLRDN